MSGKASTWETRGQHKQQACCIVQTTNTSDEEIRLQAGTAIVIV
jgi:hypothetical protein